jgi:hypothetical protein
MVDAQIFKSEIQKNVSQQYELNINGIDYRILFIKVKNSFFIEFHLGDHKYYDKVRKHLDLKKTSY